MQIVPAASFSASASAPFNPAKTAFANIIGTPFSEGIGGKTYRADVLSVGSLFEARVSDLPGVSTVGSTVGHVEDRLDDLISFFA